MNLINENPEYLDVNPATAHLELTLAMTSAGTETMRNAKKKVKDMLRGITDFNQDGERCWMNLKRSPRSYRYSVEAWKLKDDPSAYKNLTAEDNRGKLHGEHVIPLAIVLNRFLALIDEGQPVHVLRQFLLSCLEVVMLTKGESIRIDRELGLSSEMPEGWEWGDDSLARLRVAGIEIERDSPLG